ncbi:protein NBR1 homolog isoform X2 [Rhizophagus clarus]|uniref:Protein NBR1 homolog isoform X2 n=1 Tax=Rhizophagus clarus TaxID=94130 RepID=A0A8H3QJC5_9GLOM|nr:protein NBR1 homolog isoform X2 [Rhizophagus clarus]
MVNIKVIHKKAVRRFTLPSSATWIELEAKLRTLFNIPALSPFTLSYTDEDNDVITLSTDLELQEIFSSVPTVKFNLKFSTSDDSSDSDDSGNEVWVLEGRNIHPNKEVVTTTDISGLQENVSQKNIVSSTNQELQEPQR